MACKIKGIDTNLDEHEFMISNETEDVLIDYKCDGRFKSLIDAHIDNLDQSTLRELIESYDMDLEDCGFDSKDDIIDEYIRYEFDIEEYLNDCDERKLNHIIQFLKNHPRLVY